MRPTSAVLASTAVLALVAGASPAYGDTLPAADLGIAKLAIHQRAGMIVVRAVGVNYGPDAADPEIAVFVPANDLRHRWCIFGSYKSGADETDGAYCDADADLAPGVEFAQKVTLRAGTPGSKMLIVARVNNLDGDDPNPANDVVGRTITMW